MIWYPYTQMKIMSAPYEIINAKGVYLYTPETKLIDSISSWWSVIHGYKHSRLDQALKDQIDNFSHVMLGGLTHAPAQKLAQKLGEVMPDGLKHCFFSDSGSVGVEVAVKMAWQFYLNQNIPHRHKILSLTHSYHGDTFKCMEIGDDEAYHFILDQSAKQNVLHVEPEISALKAMFANYGEELYAFIVEPLLQGAGGFLTYDVEFLQEARRLCDEYDVLLIFDEVATGLGRTGQMFVSNLVTPDIVVLGKGLTGGYMGHAVTIANEKVFQAFYSDNPHHALMHGPTFMGNPLACAVALESINIFLEENYLAKIACINQILREHLENFTHPLIKEIRILGACACIEVKDPNSIVGFKDFAYQRGVFNRPFLNYIYTMPPYIIKPEELIKVLEVMKAWFLKQNFNK